MKRLLTFVTVIVLLTALPAASDTPRTSTNPNTDATTAIPTSSDYVFVQLKGASTATAPGLTRKRGGKLDLAAQDVRNYRANLATERRQFLDWARLNAPRAQRAQEYDLVLNAVAMQLNGTARSALASGPNVTAVFDSALYLPTMNISTGLIKANALWGANPSNAGSGTKIGIIDTGIKESHPFIGVTKVIVERVYCSGCPGTQNDDMWSDHGTHVAGTAAGKHDVTATVAGVAITGLSGVAPGSQLGDYNVFPAGGVGFRLGGFAFSHDIARALEDAVLDGMDVVNLSIGGGVTGPHDLLAEAVNGTVAAGVVAAVANGNAGPRLFTAESPGVAEKAIAAGASTNPHFVGIPVTNGGTTAGAALGEFDNFATVTADYTVTSPANGCTAISTAAGKIALIDRGACTFTTKVRNAQNAGAIGVLVVNNVAGDPIAMAHDGTDPFPTIPAAMLGKTEGSALKPSGTVTVDGTAPQEFVTANADIIAGFSSRGPAPFTCLIKPDVTAPGVNVLSSTFVISDWAFFQGTSMSTPHVAGAAALLRWLNPDWTTDQVKSALLTRASRTVKDHVTGTDPGPLARGGGRIDLEKAAAANSFYSPASVSFGCHTGNPEINETRTVAYTGPAITNANVSIVFRTAKPSGLDVTRSVSGGAITLQLAASRAVKSGRFDGDVVVSVGGQTHRLAFFVLVDREAVP